MYLPSPKQTPPKEPVFIDLQQLPGLKPQSQPHRQEARHQPKQKVNSEKNSTPRVFDAHDHSSTFPDPTIPFQPIESKTPGKSPPQDSPVEHDNKIAEGSSVSGLLKRSTPGASPHNLSQLFPGHSNMASLEENYRRKFEKEISEGDTKFLNTDDIQFGSFLRRLENSVYGVWRYPQEAAQKGLEGITPVKITFNRRGEVVHVQLLESSGAKILDDEVFRTLKMLGPVGGFPKGYNKEEFNLIAFFQYGISRSFLR
jgi:protein TonB